MSLQCLPFATFTSGEMCALALTLHKELHQTDLDMIGGLNLVYPNLSARFINTHMTSRSTNASTSLRIVVEKEDDNRVDILRYFFPETMTVKVLPKEDNSFGVLGMRSIEGEEFDPDYCCYQTGKSLFVSSVKVEMNRHTKQYERICEPVASALLVAKAPTKTKGTQAVAENQQHGWDTFQKEIGALVLRGNRCVLVRSAKWEGMRIPSVVPRDNETPIQSAIRAVEELIEVEASEVREINHVLPVSVFLCTLRMVALVWLLCTPSMPVNHLPMVP